MSQVTIYLEPAALAAAKAAAARAHVSLSRWFSQFAEQEKVLLGKDRAKFWATVDALRSADPSEDGMDFVLTPSLRHADLGADLPREVWE